MYFVWFFSVVAVMFLWVLNPSLVFLFLTSHVILNKPRVTYILGGYNSCPNIVEYTESTSNWIQIPNDYLHQWGVSLLGDIISQIIRIQQIEGVGLEGNQNHELSWSSETKKTNNSLTGYLGLGDIWSRVYRQDSALCWICSVFLTCRVVGRTSSARRRKVPAGSGPWTSFSSPGLWLGPKCSFRSAAQKDTEEGKTTIYTLLSAGTPFRATLGTCGVRWLIFCLFWNKDSHLSSTRVDPQSNVSLKPLAADALKNYQQRSVMSGSRCVRGP